MVFSAKQYFCLAAPFQVLDGTFVSWWKGSNGVKNYYWDGKHSPSDHVCACNNTGTCLSRRVKCNCDASTPRRLSSDVNVLTDADALPVAEISFGGLEFEGHAAQFKLGPLKCAGRKVSISGLQL